MKGEFEDLICEPRRVCDFCKHSFPKDDITTATIDEGEKVNICLGCYEELQESNEVDYAENLEVKNERGL